MAYIKTTWVDGENKYSLTDQAGNVIPGLEDIKMLYTGTGGTPLSAEKMNHIESGIIKSIKAGIMSDGGTIPQTAGYDNYFYFVSPNSMQYGDNVSGGYTTHPIKCSVDQNTRIVTCYSEGSDYTTTYHYSGTVNYIEIAW